jgi:hypothetical protein
MRERRRLWIALALVMAFAAAGATVLAMPELRAALLLRASPKTLRDEVFLRFTNPAGEQLYLLGTIHGDHLTTPDYSLPDIGAAVTRLHPDLVLVEERPEQMARGAWGDGPIEMAYASLTARALGIAVEGMDWWTMNAAHAADPPERDDRMFANIAADLPNHHKILILTGFSHVDAFAARLPVLGWRPAGFATAEKDSLFDTSGLPSTFPPGMTDAIKRRIVDDSDTMAGVTDPFWKARLADAVGARQKLLAIIAKVGERPR